MGNPSGYFTSFSDPLQVLTWQTMIGKLVAHLEHRYGSGWVSGWKFESWNEPDHKDFGHLTMTPQEFLVYYDATSEGLRMNHPTCRPHKFGGPGGSCRHPRFIQYCHGLMQHADNGTNFITGRANDVKLDFISFHKKVSNGNTIEPKYMSLQCW